MKGCEISRDLPWLMLDPAKLASKKTCPTKILSLILVLCRLFGLISVALHSHAPTQKRCWSCLLRRCLHPLRSYQSSASVGFWSWVANFHFSRGFHATFGCIFLKRGAKEKGLFHWRFPVATWASRVRRSPVEHPAARSVVVRVLTLGVVIIAPVVSVMKAANHHVGLHWFSGMILGFDSKAVQWWKFGA